MRTDKASPFSFPCRRCMKCGYQTSLPFTLKVQDACLEGSEHAWKDFPNGESEDDLARAAVLIEIPLMKTNGL